MWSFVTGTISISKGMRKQERSYNMKKLISTILAFIFVLSSVVYAEQSLYENEREYFMGRVAAEPVDKNGDPVVLSEPVMTNAIADYPSYYSLADKGLSTSVKDQGYTNNCWSYAGVAAMESSLLMQNIVSSPSAIDLSESQIAWSAYRSNDKDVNKGDGSNYDMPYNYGADWQEFAAAVLSGSCELEENAPSYSYEFAKMYYGGSDLAKSGYYHLDSVESIPVNIDSIKEKLTSAGALYAGIYIDSGYFNEGRTNYYYPDELYGNHAVTIVGWDDNYSKENFSTVPEGDGAWIAKNSWGTEFGDDGYFMVSYYQYMDVVAAFKADTIDSYDNAYMYDGAGYNRFVFYYVDETDFATYGNIFTAEDDETLTAVGIYALDNSLEYTIDIYKNPEGSPDDGTKVYTQNGFTQYSGYYTIDMDSTITLEKGESFSVVVTQKGNPGNIVHIPCEIMSFDGVNYEYSAERGQSYILVNEEYIDATDVKDVEMGNVCIKAFTKYNNTDNKLSEALTNLENAISEYSSVEKGDHTDFSYERLQRGIEKAKSFIASDPSNYKIVNNYTYMLRGYYDSLQKPLYIASGDEFADYAQSFNNFTVKTTEAVLTGDIVLDNDIQTAGNYRYYGEFRGNNHKISNITKPLFGICINADISGIRGEGNVSLTADGAAIAGRLGNNSVLSRCSYSGSIESGGVCGGIVLRAENSTITDCYNNSRLSGDSAAGIVYYANNANVINCYDTSDSPFAGETGNSNFINCYTTNENDLWAETVTDEDIKEYSFAHSLNTTDSSNVNSGIWSSNGTMAVFADSENAPVYSVKLNSDNTIYRKADENTDLPVNPVYNGRVVLNWLYNGSAVENINNIYEDVALECDDALLGDVDENSVLNKKDAANILKFSSDIGTTDERQKIICDYNRDSTIDLLDVVDIMRKVANGY